MKMTSTCTSINGMIVHERRGGLSRFFVLDSSGSVVVTTDHEGRVIDPWSYWPGGETHICTEFSKPPELEWGWAESEPSRMKFGSDMKLTRGIYQPASLAQWAMWELFSSSETEDTEPWR